jgi:hypothetical protein
MRLSSLGTAAIIGSLYQPQMIDDVDCGAIGGMKIGRGNWNTRRKPAPLSLCPPEIPHDLTRARTPAAAVGSDNLTAWAMARPTVPLTLDGKQGDGAEQKFSKVHGSRLGWSSGHVLISCRGGGL